MDFFSDIFLVCVEQLCKFFTIHFHLVPPPVDGRLEEQWRAQMLKRGCGGWGEGEGGGEDTNVEEGMCVCRVSCRVEACGMGVRGEGVQG